jgi:hypothetical protein
MEFRGRCWRRRIYRGQNLLECSVKDREYSFRARNLGDAAGDSLRLSPTRPPKGFSTLNIEDQTVLYTLQQRPLNGSLNLEDAAGFSIYRVSLNGPLSI